MQDLFTSFKDNCGFGLLASIDNKPTHKNLEDAITSLSRMMHRGAVAADGKSGDGSGLLLSMPKSFMVKEAKKQGVILPKQYAVAMIFSTKSSEIDVFEKYCNRNDLSIIMKRDVPVDTNALGEYALNALPTITQVFVAPDSIMSFSRFEALIYLTRKETEFKLKDKPDFYIPSFSSTTISYKGLVMPTHIKEFYKDLQEKDFKISFCLFHQRFSTNTLPQWKLAQPFRNIAHNGEINSVEANRFNVMAKAGAITSKVFNKQELDRILRILLQDGMSDSASLDNFFEFLQVNGVDFFKTARSLVPAPWQNAPHMDPELRAFYEYRSTCFEPWDGPAAVSMTDGRFIGCVIDRNGLRPAKYIVTKDRRLLITSEYGVLDIESSNMLERGRLQSGEMMGLDLKSGKVLKNEDINEYLKSRESYNEWLSDNMVYLQEQVDSNVATIYELEKDELEAKQRYFNITHEVIDQVIEPMLKDGKEATGSMGDDTPLAAFSTKQRNFSDFFKQKFAQVTNPPIDPIREKVVMSLNTGFGEIINILDDGAHHTKRLKSISPILSKEKMEILEQYGTESSPRYDASYKAKTYDSTFKTDLKASLEALVETISSDVKNNGVRTIFLDDRAVDSENKTLPMAMLVGRLNKVLLQKRLHHLVSIVVVTGEVYDAHMAALMLGFGATAIYPYLLYSTVATLIRKQDPDANLTLDIKRIRSAINGGLMKIMSKMGIATMASYRNSALFDVLGLSGDIVDECFHGARGLIRGLTYADIEERLTTYHTKAYTKHNSLYPLNIGGFYKYLDGEEYHDYAPKTVHAIHKASKSGKTKDFQALKNIINKRNKKYIRDYFEFNSDKDPIALDEVESNDEIFKRFATAAMSLGSISPEAHECMAEAMNTIGGMSNSGEGGEDAARFGTIKNSNIKQIASGRFGVTPAYLRSAKELQIKVAQGAKPGEGGQLPGHKVTKLIGRLRHTTPGVTLISPPPHHDIYSIEDLAQLIYDLKQANPKAQVAVKLVSTIGVGTIAAGVAKAYADKVIISGADGGTGAAQLGSIKFAGNPWELGLIEAHNALKANGLRGQVKVETDGGLKTGLDVVKAAILGAESYAFGTGALTILGCKILRICHLNRCSVGIATQEDKLREHYEGTVERLINYFTLLADDVREILASLGYNSMEEIIGQTHLLKVIDDEFAKKFDFESLLVNLEGENTNQVEFNDPYDKNEFEKEILKEVMPTIKNPNDSIVLNKEISNLNRSFGTRISGEIAQYYGDKGLPEGSIRLNLKGTAGQSLGAFLSSGVSIYVNGAGNDYVGKGMSGGRIVITNDLSGEQYSLAGNTCLYGATGGKLYVTGQVGERFAVRNSGCIAIVEGTGDHPCEYMTGGVVIILGKTGMNFGAGMTGGVSFVYDAEHEFSEKVNPELVEARRIDTDDTDTERYYLKKLLKDYYRDTNSAKAKDILDNFRVEIRNFWIVRPKDMMSRPLKIEEGE
ncbi:MAG: Glutamate synthase [NADPH] large chain (EC [uncultured Sulfurovum sp.]|uniref:Glutamate synthase [NADPH] large chain (EC) n=1 Tax=uncultured Sulfurovum sp. TaxID=269237 RepID=A0A6S6S4P8_9BACT|nr:MAG: Glutamate synthase [NADPH] large chain (EC [uncultured Sulfurovum sp.]